MGESRKITRTTNGSRINRDYVAKQSGDYGRGIRNPLRVFSLCKHFFKTNVHFCESVTNIILLQMNCETDFVARNREFQKLVSTITSACHNHVQQSTTSPDTYSKVNVYFHFLYMHYFNSFLINKPVVPIYRRFS